uniref:ATP synthase F0 subunit 8 n=1 Tax=Ergatettix dorsifera TaxID=2571036 RepID=A0A6G6A5T3_9ORTH|nr:ATP synthase F0 subunit 8 [Ergatettix dorsifera]QID03645.1 ATP synthase F0 subunit 8 [Ergatettix dorsifera]
MPQMMNLMWLPLMMYFSMAMMLMSTVIFSMKTPQIKIKNSNLNNLKMKPWLW